MAPKADNRVEVPAQITVSAAVTLTWVKGCTATVMVAVLVQPSADVPVMVYTVVSVGDAIGLAMVASLRPAAGLQV